MSETLSPETCAALGRLLSPPPHDRAAAAAVAAALRALLPEARVTYYLGAEHRLWAPEEAPASLRPPASGSPGEGGWGEERLCYQRASMPAGEVGAAVTPEDAEAVRPRLELASELLWSAWRAGASRRRGAEEVLTLGEATGGMLHALNNHLNGMVMHAALLQAQAPEALRERAGSIRRLGGEAAQLAQAAQSVRLWPAEAGEAADLYTAFLEARGEAGDEGLSCSGGDAGAIRVPASRAGLRRLMLLLIRVARGAAGGAALRVRLSPAPGEQFRLALPGAAAERDEQGQLRLVPALSPFGELERQAAGWLAREQGGRLEVVEGGDGPELRVGWPGVA